eukprot:6468158-Amphidinium_carterae.2
MNFGHLSAIFPGIRHLILAPKQHAACGKAVPPRLNNHGSSPTSFGTKMFNIIAAVGPAILQNGCPSPDWCRTERVTSLTVRIRRSTIPFDSCLLGVLSNQANPRSRHAFEYSNALSDFTLILCHSTSVPMKCRRALTTFSALLSLAGYMKQNLVASSIINNAHLSP